MNDRELTIVSGLSGSGKTVALRTLEDLGYYCVDNLPVELLPAFVDSVAGHEGAKRLAVSIDVRNRDADLTRIGEWLAAVGTRGIQSRLVYFDSSDDALLKRYADTRRRHPLSHLGLGLPDAITLERQVMKPVRAVADLQIDSSAMNVHQLRRWVVTELEAGQRPGLTLLFESFAYKRGVPADADFVFDARCLPNPHWDPALRPLSGRDAAVATWFEAQEPVQRYLGQIQSFVGHWLPLFNSESRSYLTVAVGCTGGRHRSVFLAEAMATHFRAQGHDDTLTFHREID